MPITPERAAYLTSQCDVEFDHHRPENIRYWARLWQESKYHYGEGKDVLEAVINAHRTATPVKKRGRRAHRS